MTSAMREGSTSCSVRGVLTTIVFQLGLVKGRGDQNTHREQEEDGQQLEAVTTRGKATGCAACHTATTTTNPPVPSSPAHMCSAVLRTTYCTSLRARYSLDRTVA